MSHVGKQTATAPAHNPQPFLTITTTNNSNNNNNNNNCWEADLFICQ